MILSISGVVLLGIIVFLFFRKDGLKASHAVVCRSLRVLPREHGHRSEHQGRRGEPGRASSAGSSSDVPPPRTHLQETAVARRPLPRILSNGSAQIARSRDLARTAADSATDVLHPLITITRGLRRLAAAGRRKWADTPKDRRGPLLFLVASVVLVVALVPYGPLLAVITLMAAAAWAGRDRTPPEPTGPDESQTQRLQSLYEALVPYFSAAEDPDPALRPRRRLGEGLRLVRLRRRRARVPAPRSATRRTSPTARRSPVPGSSSCCTPSRAAAASTTSTWDEEGNELTVTVLPPLPTDIAAQRFVTAPGETVLGFTDPADVQRTLPLTYGEEQRDVPPVVWRTGVRSTEPHLLVAGEPGSGTTTLLRSIALQALQYGDVVIVEGGGTGEYACLTGRDGVLAVECGLAGALASLEWAAHETERRLIAANRARQAGHPAPDDTRHPLWILLDRPSALGHLAAADGRKDPQSLLQVPLRHGRAAGVTVVVAEQFDGLDSLSDAVRRHTRARVVLGPASTAQLEAVLGRAPAHHSHPRRAARPRLRPPGHRARPPPPGPGHPGPVRRRDERGPSAGGAGTPAGADDSGGGEPTARTGGPAESRAGRFAPAALAVPEGSSAGAREAGPPIVRPGGRRPAGAAAGLDGLVLERRTGPT